MTDVVLRQQAVDDTEAAIKHYLADAGPDVAEAFIDALERAYEQLADYPASGSPRYGGHLGIADLRSLASSSFPYLVMYVERDDHVDVWRVLHGKRDIPATLQEP